MFSITLSSCNEDDIDVRELEGIWNLESYRDKTTLQSDTVLAEYGASIKFLEGSEILVSTFCNSGGGKVGIDGNQVKVVELGMTEIGCQFIDEYETRFTNNLSGKYLIESDKLTIISDLDTDLFLVKADI